MVREAHRLISKDTGRFLVVIPTEGSPAYSLARKLLKIEDWGEALLTPTRIYVKAMRAAMQAGDLRGADKVDRHVSS